MASKLNTGYLSTHRGIIKILQIVFGVIVCTLLCIGGFGGCFYEGRTGVSSTINAIFVVTNIIFFVLNLMSVAQNKWERIYTLVGLVAFIIAFVLMLWFLFEFRRYYGTHVPATVFIGIQMALFIWDYRILHGSA